MRRQLIAASVVFLLVGFILGFFVARSSQPSEITRSAEHSSEDLPEDHPSPEVLEQLSGLMQQVEHNPEDRKSLVELGNSFYDMGRFDAAVQWYERALELDSSDINVLTDLGTSYLYTGDSEAALKQFSRSLEIDPNHSQTLQNMGVAYFSSGKYEEAVTVWERLITAHPDYQRAAEIKEQIETAKLHLEQVSPR